MEYVSTQEEGILIKYYLIIIKLCKQDSQINKWELSGKLLDRGAEGSSLSGVTVLCP